MTTIELNSKSITKICLENLQIFGNKNIYFQIVNGAKKSTSEHNTILDLIITKTRQRFWDTDKKVLVRKLVSLNVVL